MATPTSGSSGRVVGGMARANSAGTRPASSSRRLATPLGVRRKETDS
jgi:hypothetical protein